MFFSCVSVSVNKDVQFPAHFSMLVFPINVATVTLGHDISTHQNKEMTKQPKSGQAVQVSK